MAKAQLLASLTTFNPGQNERHRSQNLETLPTKSIPGCSLSANGAGLTRVFLPHHVQPQQDTRMHVPASFTENKAEQVSTDRVEMGEIVIAAGRIPRRIPLNALTAPQRPHAPTPVTPLSPLCCC